MTHVFISHASENRDDANALVALIESKGMTAWIAPRDVRPGFDYSEELQRALENCTAFVVLVTEHANTSPYVRAETEMAFSNQKPMLPVRLADIAAGPGLAFFLKIRHWTDAWGPNRDAALARLVLELQTLTGTAPSWAPKAGPAAAPPPPAPAPSPAQPAAPPPLAMVSPAPRAVAPNRTRLLIVALIAFAALAAGLWFLTRRAPPPQVNGFTPIPAPTPAPAPAPAPPPAQARSYADELADFGVAPKTELEANVGSPTPLSIPIGVRVTTDEVRQLVTDNRTILVDVLVNPHPQTLPGALYMPLGGAAGNFNDEDQAQFAQQLSQATGGDTTRPLVFFCQGARCWESYNAALRANAAGYSQIYWYRGGLAAWQEAGLQMQALQTGNGRHGRAMRPGLGTAMLLALIIAACGKGDDRAAGNAAQTAQACSPPRAGWMRPGPLMGGMPFNRISLNHEGAIYWNGQRTDLAHLTRYLSEAAPLNPEPVTFLQTEMGVSCASSSAFVTRWSIA